jgi:predicted RNA-binding Zn-ribbon protein involved in translation (DUF1610 family)
MGQAANAGSADEDPLESDQDSTDDPGVITCTSCGKSISELADRCPHCGKFIACDGTALQCQPKLFVVTTVAIIVALALGYVCMK